MCSLLYSPKVTLNTTSNARPPTGMADANLAQQLRSHAVDAYSFAMNASTALYPLSVPDAGAAYNSSSYEDDLVSDVVYPRTILRFQTLKIILYRLLLPSRLPCLPIRPHTIPKLWNITGISRPVPLVER